MPAGSRDFGLLWSVGAGISGVYRIQQTQLTTSNKRLFPGLIVLGSVGSFSAPVLHIRGRAGNLQGFRIRGIAAALT